jgi:hypothetical protein
LGSQISENDNNNKSVTQQKAVNSIASAKYLKHSSSGDGRNLSREERKSQVEKNLEDLDYFNSLNEG